MADLDRLEGFAPLAVVPMHRRVAGLPHAVQEIHDFPRRDTLGLHATEHLHEVEPLLQPHARPLRDDERESLRELPRLDQRGVRVVEEIRLGEPAQRGEGSVQLREVVEIAL